MLNEKYMVNYYVNIFDLLDGKGIVFFIFVKCYLSIGFT